jgi:hypothetical protein
LSVKRRRRDCRSDTFQKLLARSVLAMHEEAAELAKPPDHDVRPTTHCRITGRGVAVCAAVPAAFT